jgi:hypothetical protein
MSRVRLAYALALLGILITTGGCAESATAPEATLRGTAAAEARSSRPATPADSVVTPNSGDDVSITSGHIVGGGRASEP